MKRNSDFLLKDVAGKQVLVPVGSAARAFPGMITVNGTGKYVWELLAREQTVANLVSAITERYEISADIAEKDVCLFIERLRSVKAVID